MIQTDGLNIGSPASSQVSVEPDPVSDGTRARIMTWVWRPIVCMMVVGGARQAMVGESTMDRVAGGVIAAIGLPFAWGLLRRCGRYVRGRYRIHRDRCARCGYPTAGLLNARCPECGADPFELG